MYVRFGDLLVDPRFELNPGSYYAINATDGRRCTVRRRAVYAADKSDLSFEEWERTVFLPRMCTPTPEMLAARERAPPPPPDDNKTWKREIAIRESIESVTAPSLASSSVPFSQLLESFTKPTTAPVTTTTLPPTIAPPTTQMAPAPSALWLLDAAKRFTN